MDFSFSEEQLTIRRAVAQICGRFDDSYWLKCDRTASFPQEFADEVARADVVRVARRRVRERPSQAKLGGVRILGSVRCGLRGLAFQTRDGLAVRDGKPDLAPRWG